MSSKWEQYKASTIAANKSSKSNRWEKYRADNKTIQETNPINQQPAENQESPNLQQQHPYLYKLAEMLQGTPGLEQAGNIAGSINRNIEQTGLPSAAKGFLGTGVEMGRGIANLIPGVNLPQQQYSNLYVNPTFGKTMELGGGLGMGFPVVKGIQMGQKAMNALPYAEKIPQIIKNLAPAAAVSSAITPEHRLLGAGLGAAVEALPAGYQGIKNLFQQASPKIKSKALIDAMMKHEREAQALHELESESKDLFKTANPEKLMKSAAEKEKELETAQLFQKNRLGNLEQLPGRQTVPEMEHHVANVNEQIAQQLGEAEPHIQKLGEALVNDIEGVPTIEPHPKTGLPRVIRHGGERERIGKQYDELEENLPDVKIPNSVPMKEIENELNGYINKKGNLSPERKESLRQVLIKSYPSNEKTVNGKAFFRTYRTLRKIEGEQRSKAYGLNPESHDEWMARADETKKTYEDMEKIINDHFPEDTLKRLHQINHEYATKVAPLHENPLYQQLLHHGRYKGNVIDALSGTTPGNTILNNMIKNNPEYTRLLLGKEFAHQPQKLLKPNELTNQYIQNNPDIANLLNIQQEVNKGLQAVKQQSELFEHIKNIPQLKVDVLKQKKLADEIKTQLERTSLSKEERYKKTHELENAERNYKKLRKKLLATLIGGGALSIPIKKLFD